MPEQLLNHLGAERPIPLDQWSRLEPIERWTLCKVAQSNAPQTITRAYEKTVTCSQRLTHINHNGEAWVAPFGDKAVTARRAVATSQVTLSAQAHR